MENKNSNFNPFVLIVPFLPILHIYRLPNVSIFTIGDLAVIILFIYSLLKNNYRINNKMYAIFLTYSVVISLSMVFLGIREDYSEVINRMLRELLYGFCFLIWSNKNYFSKTQILDLYNKISIFLSSLVYIQYIGIIFFHKYIFFWFKKLPLHVAMDNSTFLNNIIYSINTGDYRPSGIFTEPAHFAQYILPMLIITIFLKKNIKLEIFFLGAILISGSSNGIISLVVIIIIQLLLLIKTKKYLIPVYCLLFISFFIIYAKLGLHQTIMEKFLGFGSSISHTSANLRIYRGFNLFSQLPMVFSILGVGGGSIISIIKKIELTDYYSFAGDYINSISYLLISYGIIGFTLYILSFKEYIFSKKYTITNLVMIIILFVLLSTSSLYVSPIYLLMLLLIDLDYSEDEVLIF